MKNPELNKILAQWSGFTTGQAVANGISRQTLCDCCESGKLVRLSRGVYMPASGGNSESPEIETLQRRGGDFVLCLFSALNFYHIGTQNPREVWIMVRSNGHIPKVNFPLECIRCSERYYQAMISSQTLNGLPLKVYTPAKTVADCFRFRNRIGVDVALEALRDGWNKKLFTADELYRAAEVCRVAKIMIPYMEMLPG